MVFRDMLTNCSDLPKIENWDKATHCKVAFVILKELKCERRDCTPLQRDLMIQSLVVVCEDFSEDTSAMVTAGLGDLIHFLISSFDHIFSTRERDTDECNLKAIVHICGALGVASYQCREFLYEKHIIEKIIDRVVFYSNETENCNIVNSVEAIRNRFEQARLVCELFAVIRKEVALLSEQIYDLNEFWSLWEVNLQERITSSSVMISSRAAITSSVLNWCTTPEKKTLLRDSMLIPDMVSRCDINDLVNCSHLLKIFIFFGEHHFLKELVLNDYSCQFITIFMATMRGEEFTLSDALMKQWLCKRICSNYQLRNLVFGAEGALLNVLAVLRTATIDIEGPLYILSPFFDLIPNKPLLNSELIKLFGTFFQHGETDIIRRMAIEVLQVIAKGSQNSALINSVSKSFADSELLFELVDVIVAEDVMTEWRLKASSLLFNLLEHATIRMSIVENSSRFLRCFSSSVKDGVGYWSLGTILKTLSGHPLVYRKLIESDVVHLLTENLKSLLSISSMDTTTKGKCVLNIMELLDTIPHISLCSAQFDDVNRYLSAHDDAVIRQAAVVMKRRST